MLLHSLLCISFVHLVGEGQQQQHPEDLLEVPGRCNGHCTRAPLMIAIVKHI